MVAVSVVAVSAFVISKAESHLQMVILSCGFVRVKNFVGNEPFGNLPQRQYRRFVVLDWHHGFRAELAHLARAARGEHNQFEPVIDVLKAIFDSDSSHLKAPDLKRARKCSCGVELRQEIVDEVPVAIELHGALQAFGA